MSPMAPAPLRDEERRAAAKLALGSVRDQLAAAGARPGAPAPTRPTDELTKLKQRCEYVERLLHDQRERAQRFELALGEIAAATRRLSGQTTARVHQLASDALGLDVEPPAAPSEEPFT